MSLYGLYHPPTNTWRSRLDRNSWETDKFFAQSFTSFKNAEKGLKDGIKTWKYYENAWLPHNSEAKKNLKIWNEAIVAELEENKENESDRLTSIEKRLDKLESFMRMRTPLV